ncbi:MAG: SRPBCC family protein [Candidatus Omnitrophota bacterium]|jgi:ribosome-associated toxin RatA of RatAB toxin-antitoxin module
MHNIKSSIFIKAPKELVFSVIKDMHSYPTFMNYVKNIDVTKISDDEFISNWAIDIEGADIEWEERDVFNEKKGEMLFNMIKGDYGNYYGTWVIKSINGKIELSIDLYVDWHISSFEKIIGPTLECKTRKVIRGMLTAIKLRSQRICEKRIEK